MNPKHVFVPILMALSPAMVLASHQQVLNVAGQNDVAVDRLAVQAAVNSASPGDTILLEGTFQFDGTPVVVRSSRLTIAGEVVDNDGDGAYNEDRPDGIDNDNDGLVDEDGWDATVRGVDDGFGGPAADAFPNRFNDGFEVLGFDEALRHLTFRDLEFERLNRSIYLFPDYDDDGTVFVCLSSSPTNGRLDRVTIKNNAFVNGVRAVEAAGRVKKVSVRGNLFAQQSRGVLLFGQTLGCAEEDGSVVEFLPLGTPRQFAVANNEFESVSIGVNSFISRSTRVRRNLMQTRTAGVVSVEDQSMVVSRNEIVGSFAGVIGSFDDRFEGPSSGNFVFRNLIVDSFFGILIDCATTGYTAINNEFSGSALADVLLDGTAPGGSCEGVGDSFSNTVVATQFPTTVQDFGDGNRLFGSQIVDITNP